MADLLINGVDAYQTWGVTMGDGFMSALRSSAPLKEYVKNDCALMDGVQYCSENPKINERELVLQFRIEGSTPSEYDANYDAFMRVLQAGDVTIQVPSRTDKIYRLKYTGNSITYAENIQGTFGKHSAKFKEPNPTDRD